MAVLTGGPRRELMRYGVGIRRAMRMSRKPVGFGAGQIGGNPVKPLQCRAMALAGEFFQRGSIHQFHQILGADWFLNESKV
jgi:hypothetical protein